MRAQELIEEIGARAFAPEVHECRARLARMRGDARAAEREIEEARRLYAAMGATAQVERLLALAHRVRRYPRDTDQRSERDESWGSR